MTPSRLIQWIAACCLLIGFSNASAQNLLINGDFEQGPAGWANLDASNRLVKPGLGRSQTQSLHYQRSDPRSYELVSYSIDSLQLPPGRYRFGGWIRTENATEGGARICIEYEDSQSKAWRGGNYLTPVTGTSDWTLVSGEFTLTSEYSYQLRLYLQDSSVGEAWFDDIFIESTQPLWRVGILTPSHDTVHLNDPNLELASHFIGSFDSDTDASDQWLVAGQVRSDDQILHRFQKPIRAGRIRVPLDSLPQGHHDLKLQLITSRVPETVFAEEVLPLTVVGKTQPPPGATALDKQGRAWVDGRPYLPIGVYTQGLNETHIQHIATSAFNTVMPYSTFRIGYGEATGFDGVQALLDELNQQNLKVIFSLQELYPEWRSHAAREWQGIHGEDAIVTALVERFRHHPALLAWYICDEMPASRRDDLIARRRLVNRLDPHHPTWSVFYQMGELPQYLNGFDLLGLDPYPINKSADSMKLVLDNLKAARDLIETQQGGLALWMVVQAHNLGNYDPQAYGNLAYYLEEHRPPTEHEMLSMCLLNAIHGAKGFILYSYFDLFRGPEAYRQTQFDQQWPEMCRVAEALEALAPFILSDQPTVPVEVESRNDQNQVHAQGFRDENNHLRILIAGVGPGVSDAILTVNGLPTGLHSTTGKTIEIGEGQYHFTGTDICSDILVER